MNVLIIEDSLPTALMLQSFVSACGHQAMFEPSSWFACSAVDEWSFDLVLMDIVLPGIDGYELAGRLRDKGLRVPIIAVTSLDDDPAKRREYGIDGYIGKPVSMTQLKDLLEAYTTTLAKTA